MKEIRTDKELKKAVFSDDLEIHVDNKKLTVGIITRPYKHRRLLSLIRLKGYKMIAAKCFGVFDVRYS